MLDDWGLGVKPESIEDKIKKEMEENGKAAKPNVFSVISSAVDKKFVPTDEELDKLPVYIFSKYFSNDPVGLLLMSDLNVRRNIPSKWEYWYMRLMMPASIRYIRYNKKEKFEDEELLKNLMDYYKCNERRAMEYYSMLPESEVNKIREKYRYGVIGKSKVNK